MVCQDIRFFRRNLSRTFAVAIVTAGLGLAGQGAAQAQNAATAMASNPDLSQWSYIVGQAGLKMAAATNPVTVFALTDKGFNDINAVWHGALKTPGASGSPNYQKMQQLVRSQAILGLHPPSEFDGKKVTLTSVAGTPITVDGTVQGKLTVEMKYATGAVSGMPMVSDQSVIYPIVASDVHP
ncbi:hypothetical protein ACELLULO517_21160 [Acidisoma cellulosilytica]|uniref:Uncharacterized protein n=1 Tax=Acidisoma cellulosilyticum TaxID=2802395 RepID=A0A964E688_9PROT|nr:fasciclin domain-containing protein [Acidisoma cellulosilyticum]MCB8882768.1 hypothetical protein [Acidisoma cellulosilyticum]